jgi:hypothetical protein
VAGRDPRQVVWDTLRVLRHIVVLVRGLDYMSERGRRVGLEVASVAAEEIDV